MTTRLLALLRRLKARIHFRPYPLLIAVGVMIVTCAAGISTEMDLFLFSVLASPLLCVACLLWPARWTIKHWVFRGVIAVPLALVIAVSVIWTDWPLRGHFLLVRSSLDSLADRLERREHINSPVQVGLVRIQTAELNRQGVSCLWTRTNTGGDTGFVRTSADKVESQFNLWSNRTLDDEWQFVRED